MTALVEPPLQRPGTRVPGPPPEAASPPALRQLSGLHRDDVISMVGAAASAISLGLLLFGRLAPVSGVLGFVVATNLLFLTIYAFVVSLTNDRPAVVDKVMGALMTTAATVAGGALVSVIVFVGVKSTRALSHANFYTRDMRSTGPLQPLSEGGITHAIAGTLIIILLALIFTVPLGLACAVFLNETRSRAGALVRTVVDAMTALPSILAGLFIFATWILVLGAERSGLAAALAVTIMMLPIIIRSSDVVLRLVPGNLREAAAALGAPQWRTVWHVVLPTARSGLATSIILGVARGIGETAPVLLTSGFTSAMNLNPGRGPMMSLPFLTFSYVRSGEPKLIDRAYGTAAVLMVLVLGLFALARVLGGRPAGRVSPRQARRLAARSLRDLDRMDARSLELT